ncbi:uncharacterized protein KQ657_005039 [Scheffersomyces spartinae]|uniref:Uncharacterized protein n=1 Tax=Scheffersomyces spartinae TaxID=45513 RepID=A0A9P7V9F4_9ASCO|nr:uncharacterized protein KQ657_005039 [Scheffersomyces spartinae]KAG7193841.1 hypothetical protein KQ657_005039 [Scheffersomyces spartinae]
MSSASVLEDYLVDGNEMESVISREQLRTFLPAEVDDDMLDALYLELVDTRQGVLRQISENIRQNFDASKASNSLSTSAIARETVATVVSNLERAKNVVEAQVSYIQDGIDSELSMLRQLASDIGDNSVDLSKDKKFYQSIIDLEHFLDDTKNNT